jgi:hypothetical protein
MRFVSPRWPAVEFPSKQNMRVALKTINAELARHGTTCTNCNFGEPEHRLKRPL